MKKRLLTFVIACMTIMCCFAQEWVDVTAGYLQNPNITTNASGWEIYFPYASESGRKAASYVNGDVKISNFLQAYSDWSDLWEGSMMQQVSLQKGKYKLSADIIAVQQARNNWWESTPEAAAKNVYLYAKALSSMTVFKKAVTTKNNKPEHFTIEFELEEKDVVELGIYMQESNANWVAADNFKLEWYGVVTHVTSATMSRSTLSLIPTETCYLSAYAMPEEAIFRNFTWESSDNTIAKVDSKGMVTAVKEGTCTITAISADNEEVKTTCEVTVANNEPTSDNMIINEIMAANIDVYLDPSFNYGSWAELYNPSDKSILLDGLYVTDDENNLTQHQLVKGYGILPAHGYAILNFEHNEPYTAPSHRQIESKLNCDGGTLYVTDGKKIIAKADYPQAIGRMSYARTTDGGSEWSWTASPTAGYNNEYTEYATEQLPMPVVDKDGQKFKGRLQVCVNIPEGATLWYTTDGTTPVERQCEESKTGLFDINRTTTLRLRLYKEGYLPSRVVTRSYIEDDGYPLPIISVVTNEYMTLYSEETGLFSQGPNGRPGAGQDNKCNWNMDWDRPVNFEYITADNEYALSQEVDMSMCGGWSRAWTPHSFKLKASKAYDLENTMNYQFFASKPYLKHKTLQIRNGGNDNNQRIKDAALQEIVSRSGLYVDGQAWQPVHVFFNGYHYAILNMREPNNKHFAYSNYGIDTDEMDQFEMSPDSGYVQMEGTDEKFLEWYELSKTCATDSIYEKIGTMVDIDEYINYMAVEMYLRNWDWPQNNVKGFRDRNDGKFHFVLFDLDGSFDGNCSNPFSTFGGKKTYTFDNPRGRYWDNSTIKRKTNTEIKFVTIFLNMLKNAQFRKQFIDAICIVGGSVFEPTRSKQIINEMVSLYKSAGHDPSGTANNVISNINNSNTNITTMMKSYATFKLSAVTPQSVTLSSNADGAKLFINDLPVPTGSLKGKLFAPVTFKAVAPAGYKFKGWTNTSSSESKSVFKAGSTWRYYDKGSLDNQDWTSSSYSDATWKSGLAPIGYGKNQSVTTSANKSCYYFRKSVSLTDAPSSADVFILDYTIDDGMIVYVNGKEAGRYNMPSGNVTYSSLASTYANGNPDTGSMQIPGSFFKKGTNVIAVEVHNNDVNSSDIVWNASLSVSQQVTNDEDIITTEPEYEMPKTGAVTLTAIFEPLTDEEMLAQNAKPVMVNEVSAANAMYVNDYFKKNDWIELYNTTSEDIDIAGMYISDKASKPQKYQVPTDDVTLNTIIPAHGYKVIWADKLDNIGADIHTSFKLEAEGGEVLITASEFADTLKYAAHLSTQTFGRYPDGAQSTYLMNIPTIGKANNISTIDSLFCVKGGDVVNDIHYLYNKEGGMSIAYTEGVVNVKSEDAQILSLDVFSISGRKMGVASSIRSAGQYASARVADLPKGTYIARAIASDGNECHIKFIIK